MYVFNICTVISGDWLSTGTRINSVPSHIKESFAIKSDREDPSITERILQHPCVLAGKACELLMACQSVPGGRAKFVAHMTDKSKGKEQAQIYCYKSKLSFVLQQHPLLLSGRFLFVCLFVFHYPPFTPDQNPPRWSKSTSCCFGKITVPNNTPMSHCWTIVQYFLCKSSQANNMREWKNKNKNWETDCKAGL